MKVLLGLAAAARTHKSRDDSTPLDKFLSKAQITFLKKWCIDGGTARGDLQTPFKAIHDTFVKAGEYESGPVPALYRGVNLSQKEFDTLIRTGELIAKGNVQSWTAEPRMALQYASGSMVNKPKAVAVVFKKPKGTDVLIELQHIARRVGWHFKQGMPFNKEFILPGQPLKASEIVSVAFTGWSKDENEKYAATLAKLEADGFFTKPVPKAATVVLKGTPKGKLTLGKKLGVSASAKTTTRSTTRPSGRSSSRPSSRGVRR